MQSYTFSVCKQCRQALSREFHTSVPRSRSAKSAKAFMARVVKGRMEMVKPSPPPHYGSPFRRPGPIHPALSTFISNRRSGNAYQNGLATPATPGAEAIRALLLRNLKPWMSAPDTVDRFTALGLKEQELRALFAAYEPHITKEIRAETLKGDDPWSLAHIREGADIRLIVDRVLTMRLFAFVSRPESVVKGVHVPSMRALRQASDALDLRYPPEMFPVARRLRRKIFLHVGPTNSGKTYNALRALAGARSGVYAGPLRLLAHEVWERLNRGTIRPHDADPADAHRYARLCNLITGEEQRIVSDEATLSSCTVEMINIYAQYSVCVIDEIQMIADPLRGHAWTAAVLGVCAEEIHLCGEEAAVPLITELIKSTGDELEVKYYKRLTPLVVADKSLEGHWDRIRKGDCLVTFSRSSIFSLKRVVEEATGLRCAVAYGRLPPETRSEQATLFNAPDSGYDVMVASDAIGMGLNLKIKRVVFVQLTKFDGNKERHLSLSQIKQIGGRAGRFGEQGDASSAGVVTCLHQNDLPTLTKAFKMEAPPLRRAYIPLHMSVLDRMAQLLPRSFGLGAMHTLLAVAARVGENYSVPELGQKLTGMEIIDKQGVDLQLNEKMQFVLSPTVWRESLEFDVFLQYLGQFTKGKTVDLTVSLQQSGLLETLQKVKEARSHHQARPTGTPVSGYEVQTQSTLALLESLHKVLIMYAWLSFRVPVWFSQRVYAAELKAETEKAIEFVLEGIGDVKDLRPTKTLQDLRTGSTMAKIEYTQKKRVPLVLKRANLA